MKNKLILIGSVLVVIIVGLAAIASSVAKKMIEERRHDIAGLALDIGGYEVGFFTASLRLKDIKIYPSGKETPEAMLASAEKLFVRVAPMALLSGNLHIRKVELKRPEIRYVITGRRSANWDALKLGEKEEKGGPLPVIVDKVEIDDGNVSYVNNVNGQRMELKDVDIAVDDIRPAKKAGDLPTDIEFEAKIGDTDGEIKMDGEADLLGPAISFDIKGGLSSTPIGSFSSFYAGQVPFKIESGSITVSSKAKAVNNALTSSHHATISGLRTGGGLKGDLVNKFLAIHKEPIGVDVSVNGDLSTGDLSVASALSKNIAEEILKRAGGSVAGTAKEAVKKLLPDGGTSRPLEGIKNIFRK